MNRETPRAPAAVLVVFGASGDLTKRLLAPALVNLRRSGLLSDAFDVIGVARAEWDDGDFGRHVMPDEGGTAGEWTWLLQRLEYVRGDFSNPDTFRELSRRLDKKRGARSARPNVLFYMATPPHAFTTIVSNLGREKLLR
jgi:glucose-6-phosphate 1-dehydrogenase